MGRRRRLVAAVAVTGATLALPCGAGAHTHLADLRPEPEAALAQPPRAVQLVFSEPVDVVGRATRLRSRGRAIATDIVQRRGGRIVLLRPHRPLPAGRVDVRFRVLSRDGHVLRGRFGFRVRAGAATAMPATRGSGALRTSGGANAATTGAAVVHGLHHGLFVLVVGLALAGPLVLRAAGLAWPGGMLAALCLGAALVAVLCASLTWLAAEGSSPARALLPATAVSAAGTSAGAGWLLRALLWLVTAALAGWSARDGRAATRGPAVVLGAIAVSLAASGHAGSHGGAGSIAIDAVHLLAAGAWLGGLAVLAAALARTRGGAAAASRAYGRVAVVAFAALAATGVVNALLRTDGLRALTDGAYGRLVVVKAALALAIAAVAGVAVLRSRKSPDSPATSARVGGELLLGGAALTVAAILVETAPPT